MTQPINPETAADAAMNLTCQQATAAIIDYVTDDMEAARQAAFERHLHNCPDWAAFLLTYRETIRTTRSLHHEEIPEAMLNRIQRFLQERIEGTPQSDVT
jgi:anti-sigma factor RsiW